MSDINQRLEAVRIEIEKIRKSAPAGAHYEVLLMMMQILGSLAEHHIETQRRLESLEYKIEQPPRAG